MLRRDFVRVASAGSVGTVTAISGCLGGGNNNGSNIRFETSTEDTIQYAMSQALAAVINKNTDEIYVDARPSSGDLENIRSLDEETTQIGSASLSTLQDATENTGPFDDVNSDFRAVSNWYTTNGLIVTTDPNIEYVQDIEPGTSVWLGNRSGAFGVGMSRILDHIVGEGNYEWTNTSYGDLATTMSEGRVDVGVVGIMNYAAETAWGEQIKSLNDLHVVNITDENVEKVNEDPGVQVGSLDMTQYEGYESMPDEAWVMGLPYTLISTASVSEDMIYELLSTMYDYRDDIAEGHAILEPFVEDEHFVSGIPSHLVDLHEASKQFFDEKGIEYES
jgi:TRAP transporter TAXI family solute receptor